MECPNKLPIVVEEHIVVPSLCHEVGDEAFSRVVVCGLPFEDGVVHSGQRRWLSCSYFPGRSLVGLVALRKNSRHGRQIQSMVGARWVNESHVLELFKKK